MRLLRRAVLLVLAVALVVGGWKIGGHNTYFRRLVGLEPAPGHREIGIVSPYSLTPPIAPGPGDWFVDSTAGSGLDFVHVVGDGLMDNIVEALGSGGCVLDYDGDGRMDVFLANQSWRQGVSTGDRPGGTPPTDRLYRNLGGGRFQDVTDRAGLGDAGFGLGAAAADYDADGDWDLYVCRDGANLLWENQGDGRFRERAAEAGVADPGLSMAAVFFDADGDHLPDLYVANYLVYDPDYRLYYSPDAFPGPLAYEAQPDRYYRNLGQGRFQEATAAAGLDVPPGRAMGATPADVDGDGDMDLFVANDATANFLFINDGTGRYTEEARPRGVAFGVSGDATGAMMGLVCDLDGDNLPDLMVTDTAYGSWYAGTEGGRLFQDRIIASGLAGLCAQFVSWGAAAEDWDLDGDDDLLVANGDLHYRTGREDLLLLNDGTGRFTDAAAQGGACFRAKLPCRAVLAADFDDDGRRDVLVTQVGDRPLLLLNRAPAQGPWLGLALTGSESGLEGWGAEVRVTAGGRTRVRRLAMPACYLGQSDPRLLLGLGAPAADRVEVHWPSGRTSVLDRPEVNAYHRVAEAESKP